MMKPTRPISDTVRRRRAGARAGDGRHPNNDGADILARAIREKIAARMSL